MKSTVFSCLIISFISTAWANTDLGNIKVEDVIPKLLSTPFYQPGPESEEFTGGEEVEPHSRPYQVALKIYWEQEQFKFCGGSLISTSFVLTAAHCFIISGIHGVDKKIRNIEVILGAHNIRELEPTQVRMNTTEIIVHNEWLDPFQNDIALVKLPEPVTLNEYIALVSLPSDADVNNTFTGFEATVSGWGTDYHSTIIFNPSVLSSWTNPIISQTECSWFYPHAVFNFQLCVSGVRKYRSCNGDTGGPLTIRKESKEILIGVVSFGHILCSAGYPYVYTRVTSYLDWIQKHIEL